MTVANIIMPFLVRRWPVMVPMPDALCSMADSTSRPVALPGSGSPPF